MYYLFLTWINLLCTIWMISIDHVYWACFSAFSAGYCCCCFFDLIDKK